VRNSTAFADGKPLVVHGEVYELVIGDAHDLENHGLGEFIEWV
jgi:hypothetical protein